MMKDSNQWSLGDIAQGLRQTRSGEEHPLDQDRTISDKAQPSQTEGNRI